MARKIRETPVLSGKDASRFTKEIKRNESGANKVSATDYERAMRTYQRIEKDSSNCR